MISCWIFDLDDTLVGSKPVWERAERRLYELLDSSFDEEYAETYKGLNAKDVGRAIWERVRPEKQSAEWCGVTMRDLLVRSARTRCSPIAGAAELLELVEKDFVIAVASGSPLPVIEAVLEQTGWRENVSVTVSSEEVESGKPAPDVFLEAAIRLGVAPVECIVVEDSLAGVTAAKKARMRCVAVPSGDAAGISELADFCFPDLGSIDPKRVVGPL